LRYGYRRLTMASDSPAPPATVAAGACESCQTRHCASPSSMSGVDGRWSWIALNRFQRLAAFFSTRRPCRQRPLKRLRSDTSRIHCHPQGSRWENRSDQSRPGSISTEPDLATIDESMPRSGPRQPPNGGRARPGNRRLQRRAPGSARTEWTTSWKFTG
jgi:hypothetical protein